MKCLSLWEPWATLMAEGTKKIETRSWGTSYRGWLAIHAAKRYDVEAFWRLRMVKGCPSCPPKTLGKIVCIVYLFDCEKVSPLRKFSTVEQQCGDLSLGRWAWMTRSLVRLNAPIPMRGRQGLFEPELELRKRLVEEVWNVSNRYV